MLGAADGLGQPISGSSVLGNMYTYTGRELDPETGLYYYRARYYDPIAGRFLSEDPVFSTNLYAYVGDDPLSWRDPYGYAKFPPFDQVPSDWKPDPSHKNPNGTRYRDEKGRAYDHHKGQSGKQGEGSKDHWHVDKDKKKGKNKDDHYQPGDDIPSEEPEKNMCLYPCQIFLQVLLPALRRRLRLVRILAPLSGIRRGGGRFLGFRGRQGIQTMRQRQFKKFIGDYDEIDRTSRPDVRASRWNNIRNIN